MKTFKTLFLSAFLPFSAFAEGPAPSDALAVDLESIDWGEPASDGSQFTLLEGNRSLPLAFTYAFRMPAGFWDPPHSHSQDARVFVMKGVLRIATGADTGPAGAISYPAGSFVLVPAGLMHADGAEEDTIILGVAKGPWSTDYADASVAPSAGTPE